MHVHNNGKHKNRLVYFGVMKTRHQWVKYGTGPDRLVSEAGLVQGEQPPANAPVSLVVPVSQAVLLLRLLDDLQN